MNKATTLATHADAGHMSQETAVKSIASDYDVEDPMAELAKIKADKQADLDNQVTLLKAKPAPKPAAGK